MDPTGYALESDVSFEGGLNIDLSYEQYPNHSPQLAVFEPQVSRRVLMCLLWELLRIILLLFY